MSLLILFVFIAGAILGAVLLLTCLSYSVSTDDAKRRLARIQAEQRIHDAQVAAMVAMADAAEHAVASSTSVGDRWPSEVSRVEFIEGTVATVED